MLVEYSGRDFTWQRLAVNPEDFDRYNILPLKAKVADKRYERFAAEFGDRCAEVEAIPADALRNDVERAINQHIPRSAWDNQAAVEDQERRTWAAAMDQIGGVP